MKDGKSRARDLEMLSVIDGPVALLGKSGRVGRYYV